MPLSTIQPLRTWAIEVSWLTKSYAVNALESVSDFNFKTPCILISLLKLLTFNGKFISHMGSGFVTGSSIQCILYTRDSLKIALVKHRLKSCCVTIFQSVISCNLKSIIAIAVSKSRANPFLMNNFARLFLVTISSSFCADLNHQPNIYILSGKDGSLISSYEARLLA